MSGLQLALALGLAIGGGVAVAVWALVPAQPDLSDVLARLSPASRRRQGPVVVGTGQGSEERLGIWAERRLPARLLGGVPAADLTVLGMSPAQVAGKKVLAGLVGLGLPAMVGGVAAMVGLHVPFVVPVAAGLVVGITMFFGPNREVTVAARQARTDCARALTAFVELCALERASGAGAGAAMTRAAEVGDSWLFARIREELARSRYAGQQPWDGLEDLAVTLGLPELSGIADIMRQAGDENTRAYERLRARADSMRVLLQADEEQQAARVEARMYIPGLLMVAVFAAALLFPPFIRLFSS